VATDDDVESDAVDANTANDDETAKDDDVASDAVDANTANDAVPNKEPVYPNNDVELPVMISDPDIIALPVYGNGDTYPLRYDAVVANDAVPNNEPVIPLVTLSDPVIVELFWAISPFLAKNSFAIYIVLWFTVPKARVSYKYYRECNINTS